MKTKKIKTKLWINEKVVYCMICQGKMKSVFADFFQIYILLVYGLYISVAGPVYEPPD